ncbi:phytanoyl-CoA dioxygenase [Paraburkholderia bannensis]|nr:MULTISPECIES: phytanoyl-CoA dioxygenase family protein [Paraburkholderia]QNB10659.1 phytanoyl-CoA dioxygenase family protein [Paraburkholderia tropica]RQM44666.1 phytanoyl-CoA dioxygenase [Paraburkholderia bannensis]RQN34464.1 phytanoyl-CoA dioxygenase [Paraburkholderia tropica]
MMDSNTPVSTHGVARRLAGEDVVDEAAAEMRVNGYTVIDSGLSAEFIERLKTGIDRIYSTQVSELGGEQALESISDTDIARCAMAYDTDFLTVATTPNLLKLATKLLGPEFVLMQQNGIINRPDRQNYQIKWHRDLSYQHWTSSKIIAFNALLCIDEFTHENGASFVLPATHHIEEFPTDQFVRKHEKQIAAPAGSFIVLDAMLYHRGGLNVSNNIRRAVNHVIGLPFLAQQVSFETAFESTGIAPPTDPSVRKYLGFRWSPATDAKNWRERRLPRS